jgi:hypothetical protein
VLALILFPVIVAIVLGILGVVVKGLLYLLFIGIVVFLSDFSSALWGPGDGAAAPGNPSPGFDTSGHSAAPKCSNLGTRVDESNEYQAYRSRRSGDGCSRHACRWVRQRRDLYADAHAFADAQCHVASG